MEIWIVYSSLMFITGVVMYLLSRKLQLANVDNRLVAYAFGALPLPTLIIYNLVIGQNLSIPVDKLVLVSISAILFSYLGFRFSTDATKIAPNAGFSLIIQKSYAPFTALMGIILFGQVISIQAVMGITVIIGFMTIMLTGNDEKKAAGVAEKMNNKWVLYSFITFFLFGSLSITGKYFTSNGIAPNLVAMYNFVFTTIAFSIDYRGALSKENLIKLKKSHIIILILIGVLVAFWNIFMYSALKFAPNIGYVNIINASSNVAITVLAAWFFKDKLSLRKIIGVMGVVCGLVLLFV